MPELKRNFMQGRMNKDLDERLVSNGEYRDALNIQVSTAEGSDVGTARNLASNKVKDIVSYTVPYAKTGESKTVSVEVLLDGITYSPRIPSISDNIITSATPITAISSAAEVVGAASDEDDNSIYSLIASAFDYEERFSSTPKASGAVTGIHGSGTAVVINADIAALIAVGDIVTSSSTKGLLKSTKILTITDNGSTTTIGLDKTIVTQNPTNSGTGAASETYSIHAPISVGRKADMIAKTLPESLSGSDSTMKAVFVDVYEVKADWGPWNADAELNSVSFQTDNADIDPTLVATSSKIYEDSLYSFTNFVRTNVINGIVPGMEVDAVDVNGDSVWDGTYNGVYVDRVEVSTNSGGVLQQENGNPPTNTVCKLVLTKPVVLTTAQAKAGVVLKFKAERILNFKTGNSQSYTDKDISSTTVSSYTPQNTKITGIDIIDGVCYFTTDYDEPKRINVENGIEGSRINNGENNSSPNMYSTTSYLFSSDDSFGDSASLNLREVMKKNDVTVSRLGPISPPTLWMRDTKRLGPGGREAMCNNIGLGGPIEDVNESGYLHRVAEDFTFYSAAGELVEGSQGHELFVDPSGADYNRARYYSDSITQRYPYEGAWKSGDILHLYSGAHGYKVTVQIESAVGSIDYGEISHHFGYDEKKITSIKVTLLSFNEAYKTSNTDATGTTTPPATKWVAYLDEERESSAMYEEKFVRFAYRWRYNDGEVSPISPFTNPAFIGACPYLYLSEDGENRAMKNNLKWLAITDYLGGGKLSNETFPKLSKRRNSIRPIDIESVDILYKEDGNTNVYLLKNINRSEDENISNPSGEVSTVNPASNWNHSGFQGGDKHIPLFSAINPNLSGVGWPVSDTSNNPGFSIPQITGGLSTSNHLGRHSSYANSSKRGFYIVPPGAVGRVIPEMQLFRPFDNVPVTAKAQCMSSSRLIYGNYESGYNLVDDRNEPINFNFSKTLFPLPGTGGNPGYGINSKIGIGFVDHSGKMASGTIATPTLKRGRNYTVGVVFKDRYGRESSVVVGKNAGLALGEYAHRSGCSNLKLTVCPSGSIPYWAEYYKFFIKETSNEYYNLAMYKAFPALIQPNPNAGETQGNEQAVEYWLVFNSSERNKITESDTLIIGKSIDHFRRSSGDTKATYKVLAISNEAPNPFEIPGIAGGAATSHPNPELPEGITIPNADKKGKFFVKVKADANLRSNFRIQDSAASDQASVVNTRGNTIIFQTIPDPDAGLDLFYETGGAIPTYLWRENIEEIVTLGDRVVCTWVEEDGTEHVMPFGNADNINGGFQDSTNFLDRVHNSVQGVQGSPVRGVDKNIIKLRKGLLEGAGDFSLTNMLASGTDAFMKVFKQDGRIFTLAIDLSAHDANADSHLETDQLSSFTVGDGKIKYGVGNTLFYVKSATWGMAHGLNFFNAYGFGNGMQSDRILDKFNATRLDNGVKVSTTSSNYKRKKFKHGLIFSGIYNAKNGVNNLNQFIEAEGITKDLNPEYGSIQKLFSRNTDVVSFCENKILKILSSKDALFNADGNPNMTASNRVLGTAIPFSGEHGISRNPESFASNEYRCYFTDRARGAVLRLSKDGITKISDIGMKNYFADNLKSAVAIVGAFNDRKSEYDITVHSNVNSTAATKSVDTISFNESTNGWVSFRGYALEQGVSLNNTYYTFKNGKLWEHGVDPGSSARNNFYGTQYFSSVTPVFNDMPSSVKSFNLLNYEGSQARVILVNDDSTSDQVSPGFQEYYNNVSREGWYVESISTDQQVGRVLEFKEKEGKWFNSISGDPTSWTNTLGGGDGSGSGNLDSQEISFQGLGTANSVGNTNTSAGTLRTITAIMSSDQGFNTVVGDSDGIIDGGNANTITSTITITAGSGYVLNDINLDSDALDAVSGITPTISYLGTSYAHNVNIPTAGQTSATLTVTYSSTVVSSNVSFDIGYTMNPVALVNHTLNLAIEYTSEAGESASISNIASGYSIQAPTTDNSDYNVYSIGGSSDSAATAGDLLGESIYKQVYSIEAIGINPYNASTQIASFTLNSDLSNNFTAGNITAITSVNNQVNSALLATNQEKKVFNDYNDANDAAAYADGTADGKYNFTYIYGYNLNGETTSITVNIFYNPDTDGTGSQNAVDYLRIPALKTNSQLMTFGPAINPDEPSEGDHSISARFAIEVHDTDVGSNNPFSIDAVGSGLVNPYSTNLLSTNFNTDPDTFALRHAEPFSITTTFNVAGVNTDSPPLTEATVQSANDVTSDTFADLTGYDQLVIMLAPNDNQIVNVAGINSWGGIAKDATASTLLGVYKNELFYQQDNEAVAFPESTTALTNPATIVGDLSKVLKKVVFTNEPIEEGGSIIDSTNKVKMTLHFAGSTQILPEVINPANWGSQMGLHIPTPAMATNSSVATINHKYSLYLGEIYYVLASGGTLRNWDESSPTIHKIVRVGEGLSITQTEQTNYNAYNHTGADSADADATLTSITKSQLIAGTSGSNPASPDRWTGDHVNNLLKFHQVDVHGNYSSGTVITHKVKYTAGTVGGNQCEIIFYDVVATTGYRILDQAKLEEYFPDDGSWFKNATIQTTATQLGSYSGRVVGTFNSGKCTAIEFSIVYTRDSTQIVDTDADYFLDPIVLFPGNLDFSSPTLAYRES